MKSELKTESTRIIALMHFRFVANVGERSEMSRDFDRAMRWLDKTENLRVISKSNFRSILMCISRSRVDMLRNPFKVRWRYKLRLEDWPISRSSWTMDMNCYKLLAGLTFPLTDRLCSALQFRNRSHALHLLKKASSHYLAMCLWKQFIKHLHVTRIMTENFPPTFCCHSTDKPHSNNNNIFLFSSSNHLKSLAIYLTKLFTVTIVFVLTIQLAFSFKSCYVA